MRGGLVNTSCGKGGGEVIVPFNLCIDMAANTPSITSDIPQVHHYLHITIYLLQRATCKVLNRNNLSTTLQLPV